MFSEHDLISKETSQRGNVHKKTCVQESVVHRTEDEIELIRLGFYAVLLERQSTPGVDTGNALLHKVEIDPGLAV